MSTLQRAAAALGWTGHLVSDPGVLGPQVTAVVQLDQEIHRWRMANGWPPEADSAWFRSWFEPRFHDHVPVPAVHLVGILVTESDPHRALEACGSLLTLAPCAVVVAPSADPWPLIELDYYGIGVVNVRADSTAITADVAIPPEDRSVEFGPSLFGRWLREVLYRQAIEVTTRSATAP